MSFVRYSTMSRWAILRPSLSMIPRVRPQVRLAHQDYGSGEGDPAGENPQQQTNKKAKSTELEHPGPPPPKVGQKQSQQSSSPSSSQKNSESQSKDSSGGGKASSGSSSGKGVKGAQPKILNANPPGEHDEAVRQHNEEMDNRAEKAHEQVSNEDAKKDKVPPGFWSGKSWRLAEHIS